MMDAARSTARRIGFLLLLALPALGLFLLLQRHDGEDGEFLATEPGSRGEGEGGTGSPAGDGSSLSPESQGASSGSQVPDAALPPTVSGEKLEDRIREWKEGLESEDPAVRELASLGLLHFVKVERLSGAIGKAVLDLLLRALRDPDHDVWWATAVALGELGPRIGPILPELGKEILTDRWKSHRHLVFGILRNTGPEGIRIVSDLLHHEDEEVRRCAFTFLEAASFEEKDPEGRRVLVEAMGVALWDPVWREQRGKILELLSDEGGQGVPLLLGAIAKGDEALRREAIVALTNCLDCMWEAFRRESPGGEDGEPDFGRFAYKELDAARRFLKTTLPEDQGFVKDLIRRLLVDPDEVTRERAQELLMWFPDDIAPMLGEVLRTGDAPARLSAIQAIHDRGLAVVEHIEFGILSDVFRALRDPDPRVRVAAAHILSGPVGDREETIAALVDLLTDPSPEVVSSAADGLASAGGLGLAAIRKALAQPNAALRRGAAQALSRCRGYGEGARKDVAPLLEDVDPIVRGFAVRGLHEMSLKPHDPLARRLAEMRKDKDADVRREAALALVLLGLEKEEDFRILGHAPEALSSEDRWKMLNQIQWGAGYNAPKPPALLPLLSWTLAHDEDPRSRSSAAALIGRIRPHAAASVPILIRALNDPAYKVRSDAARALGQIGPAAREAIPALRQRAVEAYDVDCVIALKNIGPEAIPALESICDRCTSSEVTNMAWRALRELKGK
ncbi:MAG: HEAT repeat domain-containing protein [Planctomycetota bacterium]|jgi:HEAT repeat protein